MVGKSDYRQYTLLLNVKDVNTLPKGLKSKLVKSLENVSKIEVFCQQQHGRILLLDYMDGYLEIMMTRENATLLKL